MASQRRRRAQMLEMCREIQVDDGVDPREFFKRDFRHDNGNRKAWQLCRQVENTLGLVLTGEFEDELLQSLMVESVVPYPNASQLMVTVSVADQEQDAIDQSVILERLNRVNGRLRCEVAAAITRKRVPRLVFQVFRSA